MLNKVWLRTYFIISCIWILGIARANAAADLPAIPRAGTSTAGAPEAASSVTANCQLSLIRRILQTVKEVRERLELGRPGLAALDTGQYQAYLQRIRDSHDNARQPIASPYGPLLGYDSNRAARLQQLSADNGNSIIPSYFKNYEPAGRNTFATLETLWLREAGDNSDSWRKAMDQVADWLNEYQRYESTLAQTIVKGFEARLQAQAVLTRLEQTRPIDFQRPEIYRDGISVEIPTLTLNEETGLIDQGTKTARFRTYPEMTSTYVDAVREYSRTFGLPASPSELAKSQIASLKKVSTAQLFNPLFWLVSVPYRVVRGALGVSANSWTWLKSKFVAMGDLHDVMDAQAYRRRRLELAHDILSNRRDYLKIALDTQETQLLQMIETALLDPRLAPRSDAVRREQQMEERAEAWRYYGKASILAETLPTDNENTSSSDGEIAPSKPVLRRGLDIERNEQLSYFGRLQKIFDRHKKWFALGAVGTSLTGFVIMHLQDLVAPVAENPHFAYGEGWFADSVNLMVMKYFDPAHTGNSIFRKQAKTAYKTFDLENPAIWAIVDGHLSRYRERYRIDPKYNFLADEEFQRDLATVMDKLLAVREQYGAAALFTAGSDYLLNIGYKKAAANEIRDVLKLRYPDMTNYIDVVFNLFAANAYTYQTNMDLAPIRGRNADLYFDLRYFFEKSFADTVARVRASGVLFTERGDAYQSFVKAPKAYRDEILARERPPKSEETPPATTKTKPHDTTTASIK